MKFKLILPIFFIGLLTVFGQTEGKTTKTLQECIDLAIANNLDLKKAILAKETKLVNFKQNKNALLPSINGDYNLGVSNGRSIDPFTNAFVNEKLTFSNARLGLDAIFFNGFRLINSWKQAKLNLKASEMEAEAAKQSVILNVTLTYLQVLNATDLLRLAESRLETTQKQLSRLQSLFEEETGNPAEYRDLQGQLAADKAAISENKNNVEAEIINLNTLVNSEKQITVSPLEVDLDLDFEEFGLSSAAIYESALNVFPTIKASAFNLEAAQKGVAVARAQYIPEISLFANLNTNYSSAARFFKETGTNIVETGSFIRIDTENYAVFSNQATFTDENISYPDQFDNNLNSSFGVAVTVPIFNGFRAKNNVALEKIKTEEAQTALEQTKLDLKNAIDQSYNRMQTAFQRYNLLQDQVRAYQESFRINEIRFNNGVSNSVEYIISKNNLDNAEINLSNVGYEYILRRKILEYYQGEI